MSRKYYYDTDILELIKKSLMLFTYIGVLFFRYLSRYYPFSLFFRNRLFHYQNRDLNQLLILVERASESIGTPFKVMRLDTDQYFYNFIGNFIKCRKKISFEKVLKSISSSLETSQNNLYIRFTNDGLHKIMIPLKLIERTQIK